MTSQSQAQCRIAAQLQGVAQQTDVLHIRNAPPASEKSWFSRPVPLSKDSREIP